MIRCDGHAVRMLSHTKPERLNKKRFNKSHLFHQTARISVDLAAELVGLIGVMVVSPLWAGLWTLRGLLSF